MTPKDYSQMMAHLTRPAMARGGRIGFYRGEKVVKSHGKQIKDLTEAGESSMSIAKKLKLNRNTVNNAINAMDKGIAGEEFKLSKPRKDIVKVKVPPKRTDLQFENLTRKKNAKIQGVPVSNARGFKALPNYPNITYTDYKDKKTGRKFRTYGVRIQRQDKKVTTAATTNKQNIPTLEKAIKVRDQFRKENPLNIKPLDPEKEKITKDTRRDFIKAQEGDEAFLRGKKGTGVQKGHAGNIKNPDLKITPSSIIYTPEEINVGMAGQEGAKGAKETFTDLDYKIEVAEDKIKEIKKSNISPKEKRRLLDIQDRLLTDYHFQSGGFKTPTLSDGTVFGESTRKAMSMDQFDLFPNMTEKETKKFVRQYITEKGTLKPFYQRLVDRNEISEIDKENIRKSKLFLDNVELAKQNVKKFDVPAMKRLAAIGCPGKMMGGRVGFSKGQNLQACALKGVEKLKGDPGKLTGGDQANLRALSKSAKAARLLKNVLGPAAIAGEVLIEGGIAANKFMSEGVPIKQALGQSYLNYLLGPKTKIDVEAERAKEFAKGEDFAMAERGRRMMIPQSATADAQRQRERMEQMASLYPQYSDQQLISMIEDRGFNPQDIINQKTTTRITPAVTSTLTGLDQLRTAFQEQDALQRIADAGGVANLAGGGIAKLAGVDSGPPPSSGPNSQGLPGLLKRVKKL